MTVRTFPLDGPINLAVRVGHGPVHVRTETGLAEATVELTGDAGAVEPTTADMQGRTLTVSGPRQGGVFDLGFLGRRPGGAAVHVVVTVPSGTAIKIATFTAPIRIEGSVGGADLAFAHGGAEVDQVDGDLRVRFGGGTVRVTTVTGNAELHSGAGSAHFDEIGGALTAGFGSGNVRARVARGAVRVRSGAGSAQLECVHADVDLASGNGGLEIGLPAGTTARLDVRSGSGSVRSELPVEDAPRAPSGAISVRARTGRGDVRVFRAA